MIKNLLTCVLLCSLACAVWGEDDATQRLALLLAEEGDHGAAAIEFRRLALGDEAASAAWYQAAASEYLRAGNPRAADEAISRAEQAMAEPSPEALFLRAEQARLDGKTDEAMFYYQTILDGPDASEELRRWSALQASALELERSRTEQARAFLLSAPGDQQARIAALDRYDSGRDKRPLLGGILGLIPGLGYIYSGEYANAARSMILNGLFIFGMVTTAQEDQWGGFAVITFFEVTWYSGSIYGGVDSAHRYNLRRREECLREITGSSSWEPDYAELPLFTLQFQF